MINQLAEKLTRLSVNKKIKVNIFDIYETQSKALEEFGELAECINKKYDQDHKEKEWSDLIQMVCAMGVALGITNQEEVIKRTFNDKSRKRNSGEFFE